ncbi:MAG: DUF945 family protein [Candidatus Thioglobus sp.]|uniref:DUF945 family protein n=1 Tax=Candidatus Thioglobus sp. TaxID=2026721 RepID=UPI0026059155|nr:DUF945 family protein [Candidatus Thioglobus sp.]MDC9727209.1 DUF945 family protein [Candidatus Thioglobus sp.]
MKKLFLLLLTGWALSTFLIGEKTQSVIKDYIKQSDKQSRGLYDVSIRLTSYKKSFLSANAEIEIDIIDPAIREDIAEFVRLPIKSSLTIKHGPVFFQGNPSIGLANISDTINLSDFIADKYKYEFSKYVDDDIKIISNTKFKFNGDFSNKAEINNIEINNNDLNLKISPIIMMVNGNLDAGFDSYKSSMLIEDLTLNMPGNYFNIKDFKFDSNVDELFGGFYPLGVGQLKIEEITLRTSETNIPPISLSVKANSKAHRKNDRLFDKSEINLVILNPDKLGFKMPMDSINIVGNFSGILEEDFKSLWNLISISSTMSEDQLMNRFGEWFNTFLSRSDLDYGVKITSSKDKKDTGSMDFKLSYIGQKNTGESIDQTFLNFQANPLDLFTAELHLLVNKDWLNTLDPVALDGANTIISSLIEQGMIRESEADYSVSASYKDQTPIVNGKRFSDELAGVLNQVR